MLKTDGWAFVKAIVESQDSGKFPFPSGQLT